jgi:hypothetical protein
MHGMSPSFCNGSYLDGEIVDWDIPCLLVAKLCKPCIEDAAAPCRTEIALADHGDYPLESFGGQGNEEY